MFYSLMPAVELDVLPLPLLKKAHLLDAYNTNEEALLTVEDIQSSVSKAEALISDASEFDSVSKTISTFGSSRQSIDILCLRNMRDIVS